MRIEASPEKLRRLADLRRQFAALPIDVFGTLGFEPNCRVRHEAAAAAGHPGIIEAVRAGVALPEPCGKCPQERFLDGFDDLNTDQLYGGAAGGSKSTSLLLGTLRACATYDGLQAFWFRRTFPELDQSVLRMLSRYAYGQAIGARYVANQHELRFANDAILTFAHAKNMKEATALQSAEIQLLVIDERTTIPPDVVDFLYTRVRSGVAGVPCLGIRSATNPGNIGHSRVKADFVDATDHGAQTILDAAQRRRSFIQAKVTDTPQLGPEYIANLNAIPDPALRKAMKDGDWDVFAGQVFSEWRYERHVVLPFALPPTWRRHGGIDWGHRAPSAVLWAAVDEDGRVWVYRELYETQLGEKGLAARIKDMSATEEVVFAFDPAMMNQVGDAQPVATILQQEGISLAKGTNDRLSGWQRTHSYLAEAAACPHHRALGWETCPMLHVFDNCTELIRTLPALPYNTTGRLEDVDTDAEDHAPDALRYLLMELGAIAGVVVHSDEEWAEIQRLAAQATGGPKAPQPMHNALFAGDTSMRASGVQVPVDDDDDDEDEAPNGKTAKSPFV